MAPHRPALAACPAEAEALNWRKVAMAGLGAPKTGGRVKGTPNKMTKALKDMILGALDDAGGQEYLHRQANNNPVAFLALIGRMLPTTLAGEPANPLRVTTRIDSPGGCSTPPPWHI